MTDPLHLVVNGAAYWADALQLAQAGQRVTLVEPDPHDSARLSDMLMRCGVGIDLRAAPPKRCDVVLGQEPGAPKLDAPFLSLDWTRTHRPAVRVFLPDHGVNVVELLGDDADGAAMRLAAALCAQLVPLTMRVPISQRLLAQLSHCLEALVLSGAAPMEVDSVLCESGFVFGPFAAQDRIGVDRALAERRAAAPDRAEAPLIARAVAEGRLGRSVGVGWFRYPGDAGLVEDPLVEDMAAEEARFAGLKQTCPGAVEIVAQVRAALQAEAAALTSSGAVRVPDLDLIAQAALGTPPGFLR